MIGCCHCMENKSEMFAKSGRSIAVMFVRVNEITIIYFIQAGGDSIRRVDSKVKFRNL